MNIVVFGAGGKTGKLVVERAVEAGHTVTAFVRDRSKEQRLGVDIAVGDTGDAEAVRAAISGKDAVIDTIGGKTPYKETELERTAAKNIIDAMQSEGVRRLVVVSMMGIGESHDQAPFWYEYLLMPTFLRGSTKDKTAMESEVEASSLDYVIARPPMLTEDPATGSYTVIPPGTTGHKITRADLAAFLVGQVTNDAYVGQAVLVANS